MKILISYKKVMATTLFLVLSLILNACGGSSASNMIETNNLETTEPDISASVTNNSETMDPPDTLIDTETDTTIITDENIFPVIEQGVIRGVNITRCSAFLHSS